MNEKYIVCDGKAVITKRGVISEGEELKPGDTENFKGLIAKGVIKKGEIIDSAKEPDDVEKNYNVPVSKADIDEVVEAIEKDEELENDSTKDESKKTKKKNNGAQKKDK